MAKIIPDIQSRNKYWNKRFLKGTIYTEKPSKTVKLLLPYLKGSKKVLVVGGGYGRNAAYLAKNGFWVLSTDVSQNAINIGEKIYNFPNLKFEKKNITKLNYGRNKFDAVVAIYILSIFTKQELDRILKDVKNILKPYGKFCCNFLSINDDEYSLGIKIDKNLRLCDHKQQIVKFYSKSQIETIFKKYDFTIDKIIKVGETRFIDILNKKVVSRSWLVLGKII